MWWLACNAYAQTPETVVQQKLLAIQTMHAHFTQTVRGRRHQMMDSSGEMIVARPNRFRWQTRHPMAQTIIADGQKIWVYDVELEQVTVSKQTQNLGAAGALFLSQDAAAVQHEFTVTMQHNGMTEIFDLHAKSSKSNFERIRLIFDNNVLTNIEMDDQLGQHTTIHLSHVTVNHPEPAHLFQFRIPAGVDVVHQ